MPAPAEAHQEPVFMGLGGVPSRDGMAELEAGMMHEHGACGLLKPEHLCTHAHAPFMRNICQRESLARSGSR